MRTVFKYPLSLADDNLLTVPRNARLLTVQIQDDVYVLWADVPDASAPRETRHVYCCGTGFPVPPEAVNYLATVQFGPFAWHFFSD